jgi:hypothetical protein
MIRERRTRGDSFIHRNCCDDDPPSIARARRAHWKKDPYRKHAIFEDAVQLMN